MRRAVLNLALLLASLTFAFFSLEAAVRVITAFDDNYLDELMNYQPAAGDRDLNFADFIRTVDDDLVIYELRPGVRGRFMGHELSINGLGMRDRERNREKPPGVFRIIGLGDSHAFGWGVAQEETYLSRLEAMLQERNPGRRFEVLNLGVPGYNTVQELQIFTLRAAELSPDMVIINYVDNDMDLPNFLTRRPDLLTVRRSFLKELVGRRLAAIRGSSRLPPTLSPVVPDEQSQRYQMPEERIPERFRPLYGWENMRGAFGRLARLARERGIPYVLLLNMDDYSFRLAGKTPTVLPRRIRELVAYCAAEGYLVVDPQDRIFTYLQSQGLGNDAIWIKKNDSHSNALRHQFLADELLARIAEGGYLE